MLRSEAGASRYLKMPAIGHLPERFEVEPA